MLTQYVVDQIKANQVTLGFDEVYYGDQDRIPGGNILCVEPNDRARQLSGASRKTEVNIQLYLLIYVNKLDGVEAIRKVSDQKAEDTENLIHADPTLNGQVIHCYISRVESGFRIRDNTLIRATRLTLDITSRQILQ